MDNQLKNLNDVKGVLKNIFNSTLKESKTNDHIKIARKDLKNVIDDFKSTYNIEQDDTTKFKTMKIDNVVETLYMIDNFLTTSEIEMTNHAVITEWGLQLEDRNRWVVYTLLHRQIEKLIKMFSVDN